VLSDDIFRPRWLSKAGPVLAGAVAGVALTALIFVSPVLMSLLFVGSVDWTQASIIGQAYGLASAVLGGLAFCGVAYSLILQRRETRIALLGTSFQQYLELTKLALDDPRFLYVQDRPPDRPHNDLFAYANLLLSSIYHGWLLRTLDEETLRGAASALFAGPIVREHWQQVGQNWIPQVARRDVQFMQILNEEYEAAVAAGPPNWPPPPLPADGQRRPHSGSKVENSLDDRALARLFTALAAGAALGAGVAKISDALAAVGTAAIRGRSARLGQR